MTTPSITEQRLHQVVVTFRGKPIPVGPRMQKSACVEWAAAIRKSIAEGKERDWSDPQVVPCDVKASH